MVNVLATMAQLEARPGKPSLKSDATARGDVSAVIGLVSNQNAGSMAISFPEPVIFDIVRRMLGEDITAVDDTVRDLTGEISNMVLGGAKAQFQEQGFEFGMSTPVVISGKGHVIQHSVTGPKILLPFSTDVGEFFVEISFEK